MRRFIMVLLLAGLPTATAMANPPDEDILRPYIPERGDFFLQFDLGVNGTWLDGNPIYRAFFPSEEEASMFRNSTGFEPYGALSFGYRVTPNVRLRLRAAYDSRRADNAGDVVDTCPLLDPITGVVIGGNPIGVHKEYALVVRYATLSLTAEYLLTRFFLYAGPAWSKPMTRQFNETDQLLDQSSSCIYFPQTPDTTRSIRASTTDIGSVRSLFAIVAGAGYVFDLVPQFAFVPEISIVMPFGDLLKTDEPYQFQPVESATARPRTTRLNQHMIMRSLRATLGLRFSF